GSFSEWTERQWLRRSQLRSTAEGILSGGNSGRTCRATETGRTAIAGSLPYRTDLLLCDKPADQTLRGRLRRQHHGPPLLQELLHKSPLISRHYAELYSQALAGRDSDHLCHHHPGVLPDPGCSRRSLRLRSRTAAGSGGKPEREV